MCPETEDDSRFRIFLQISKIVFVPILLSTLFSCESIEFIPDTVLREEFGFSHKVLGMKSKFVILLLQNHIAHTVKSLFVHLQMVESRII